MFQMGSEMDKMSHQSEKGKIVPKVLQDQEGAPLKITGMAACNWIDRKCNQFLIVNGLPCLLKDQKLHV